MSLPLMDLEPLCQSDWGLSVLFKVTSVVVFEKWFGVSYQILYFLCV